MGHWNHGEQFGDHVGLFEGALHMFGQGDRQGPGLMPGLGQFGRALHAHLARDAEMRVRFRREAEAASRLLHPLICAPIDYGEAGEVVYLVLPYLGGGCLADDLNKTRTVETLRAARICAQVATALDYAHRQGVVHRDVKPSNVLLENGIERAKLTDFGLATCAVDNVELTSVNLAP